MRKSFLFIVIIILFFGCAEDQTIASEGEETSKNVLVGKWQVVESFYSIGTGEQLSNPIQNGSILLLKNDGKFETNLIKGATGGSYEIKGDSLILNFRRALNSSEYIYGFSIKNESLHISPLSPNRCVEGCSERLKKVD